MQEAITKKINLHIKDIEYLSVEDVTHQHRDHLPDGTSETHFNITIISDMFFGMPMVQRHRYVYKILNFELTHGVHALSLVLYTTQEYQDETGYTNHKSWTAH